MLYNLDFLGEGKFFPPDSERERLNTYNKNRLLFNGNHEEVFKEQFKRIQRVVNNFEQVISYAVTFNYYQLITKKITDLLVGEVPVITASDNKSKQQAAIDKIIENTSLYKKLYMALMDTSRYAHGLLLVYKDKYTGAGNIDVTQPSMWYPIVDPMNIHRIQYHVLAYVNNTGTRLKVQIHSRGSYEEREYELKDDKIIKQLKEPIVTKTGLDDFAILPIFNLQTSDNFYGFNDYEDLDSIISEIEVRASQIARILDIHSDPIIQVPAFACEQDPVTGEWSFKIGNTIASESKEQPDAKYITWDGQLEACFKKIELLINQLYTISEMGSAIFNIDKNSGDVPSGSALRRLLISPLAKVNRIKLNADPIVKRAIKLCSQLGGTDIVNLSSEKVNITWQDGLPSDPKEDAEIMNTRTGGKPTISQHEAIKRLDNKDDESAEVELSKIQEEESINNPFNSSGFSE